MATYERHTYIVDLVTQQWLEIQWVPKELSYKPDSNWVAIHSSGRNNPLYHYTGSEDTLEFELDWYAEFKDRGDVIDKCRWLESLSKNNGWEEPPHHVAIIFGNVFNDNSTWIVASAPYRLSDFHAPTQMMPIQAYQTITLKRVTKKNLTYEDVRTKGNRYGLNNEGKNIGGVGLRLDNFKNREKVQGYNKLGLGVR